jgi:uncharacterized protein involved in exopolysaccharide biosynthesis
MEKLELNENKYIEEDEIDLLELLGILLKYKKKIMFITAAGAGLALFISVLSLVLPPQLGVLPNKYKPHALILINEKQTGGLGAAINASGLSSFAGMAGITAGSSYGELFVKLVNSRSILDPVIEEFNIAQRYKIKKHVKTLSRKALQDRLSASYDKDTGTVNLSFEDYDPAFGRDLVNRLVELLDLRFASIGGNKFMTKKALLEDQLAQVEKSISELEAQIKAYQTKYGFLDIQSLATEQVSVAAQLRSQLILKEMEIKTYSDFSKIDDPVSKRLKTERDNLKRLINEMDKGYSEYQGMLPAQKEMPAIALAFSHLKRDLLIKNKVYELLIQQYEMVNLSLEGEEPIFQILEMAEAPDKKSGPRRSIICIGSTFAAFFIAVMYAFIHNAVINIRRNPERMKKLKGN